MKREEAEAIYDLGKEVVVLIPLLHPSLKPLQILNEKQVVKKGMLVKTSKWWSIQMLLSSLPRKHALIAVLL
jgi:hypothetical protein